MKKTALRDDVKLLVKDEAGRLKDPVDFDFGIRFSLAYYSQRRPLNAALVTQVGPDYQVLLSDLPGFDEGFSDMLQVEYPVVSASEPNFIGTGEWIITNNDSGLRVIQFISIEGTLPNVGDDVKIHFAKRHVIPTGEDDLFTVQDSDLEMVGCLAASWCLQQLANLYTQLSQKASLMADITNYDRKTEDCAARAKTLRDLFDSYMSLGSGSGSTTGRDVKTGTVELVRS